MYLGRSYEDVFAAAVSVTKNILFHRTGMYYPQIHQTAAIFGVTLHTRPVKSVASLETACGLLGLTCTTGKHGKHVVFLKAGLVFDGDSTVWDIETYLANGFKPPLCLTAAVDEEEQGEG